MPRKPALNVFVSCSTENVTVEKCGSDSQTPSGMRPRTGRTSSMSRSSWPECR